MESLQRISTSRALVASLRRSNKQLARNFRPLPTQSSASTSRPVLRQQQRHSSSKIPSPSNSKPIVLEQPDQFRPPSHPSRLIKPRGRASGGTYNGAYNQSSTTAEREGQRNKRYPHMFPDEGTLAHSLLTNKMLHVLIAMVGYGHGRG